MARQCKPPESASGTQRPQSTVQGEIRLLMAYTKAKFDTLPDEFLLKLKERYDV